MRVKVSEPGIYEALRSNSEGRRIYRCVCKCGSEYEASKKDFNSGKSRACSSCRPANRYDSPAIRIMKNVEIVTESGCWIWLGKLNDSGYAVGKISGKEKRLHRVMFTLVHGDPGELMVLHKCDTRCCVNPSHLFKGTAMDNIQDCMKKGRFMPGIIARDERRRLAKLGDEIDLPEGLV